MVEDMATRVFSSNCRRQGGLHFKGWHDGGTTQLHKARDRSFHKGQHALAMFSGNMSGRWRELHGSDRWDGLLDPLDVDLRRLLITYEMIMATYEAFIAERRSPNAGMCRYRRADLLRRVEVSRPEWYHVTRYIYATASADVHGKVLLRPFCRDGRATECNWMGYVAVATDEGVAALGRRDIVVAWRGTQRALEWVADMKLGFASAAGILGPEGADGSDPSVHRGYLSLYTSSDQCSGLSKQSARMQVLTEIAS
ncbi:hypothetical protein QYE76_054266 [Lolium multiflorum]|uniref:Phospholipase A1 n=1 Tax=Lolium multiflorum TaxID=4521 RepID=A0AAD8SY97_LOLMU|nr:hypothetical protein QYE76_054266 [Lolium multiflorum]